MIDLRMRRVRWIAAGVGLMVAAIGVLVITSRRCSIVVYNETAGPLAGVTVAGSGFVWRVPLLESGQSRLTGVAAQLPGGGWTARVGLLATDSGDTWFEPGPGRRLIVRVWSGEIIEMEAMNAWWEQARSGS